MTTRTVIIQSKAVMTNVIKFLLTLRPEERPIKLVMSDYKPQRTLSQNSTFHGLCGQLETSGLEWCGQERSLAHWKVIMISGHAVVSCKGADMIEGAEGELINLLEESHAMDTGRAADLITYTMAFLSSHGIQPKYGSRE